MGKRYFITFGNDLFKNQVKRLGKQAEDTGWFDGGVVVETPKTIQHFYNTHKDFIDSNARGYGYWIWKPYIILRQLREMNDGDFLFYTDAGATIVPHKKDQFDEYISTMDRLDKPIITFGIPQQLERDFQKERVLNYFTKNQKPIGEDLDFMNSGQVESGVFMCKKTQFTLNFVLAWLELVLIDNYSLVIDEDEFDKHRHDQSILSILCKLNDIFIKWDGDAYGIGPFFSSRITDLGPRKLAPDTFRTFIGYNPNKHFRYWDWVIDNEFIHQFEIPELGVFTAKFDAETGKLVDGMLKKLKY